MWSENRLVIKDEFHLHLRGEIMSLGDGIGRNKGVSCWKQLRQNDYYKGARDFIEWLLTNDKYAACTIDTDEEYILCEAGLIEDNWTESADELFKEFQKSK